MGKTIVLNESQLSTLVNGNSNLHKARTAKNDEFYTQMEDIVDELSHYGNQFKGKVVYCNCDGSKSNFRKFFTQNFSSLGLKKLICTGFGGEYLLIERGKEPFLGHLNGDGDFRSQECIKLLEMADIVVSNPPFSLFREYFSQLIAHKKKFIVIGNGNAMTYKEVFPYMVNNQLRLGHNMVSNFVKPDGSTQKFGNIVWFTNMVTEKGNSGIMLTKRYNPEEHFKFDGYDAICANTMKDIPYDFDGIIGAPISIMSKVSSDNMIHFDSPEGEVRFKVVGEFNHGRDNEFDFAKAMVGGKEKFKKIAIKKV